MGAWKRILNLSKAAVNQTLDKLEQPVMMMNQYIRNLEEELHSLQTRIHKETAAQRQLEQQTAAYNRMAEQSEQKAGEAMADYRMVEARQALEAKLDYLDRAAEAARAYEASKLRGSELEQQWSQAKAEYDSLLAKREELTERARKLQAQEQVQADASYGLRGAFSCRPSDAAGSAARGFQRIEEAMLQKEAELELAQSMRAAAAASREALIEEQLTRLRNQTPAQQ